MAKARSIWRLWGPLLPGYVYMRFGVCGKELISLPCSGLMRCGAPVFFLKDTMLQLFGQWWAEPQLPNEFISLIARSVGLRPSLAHFYGR